MKIKLYRYTKNGIRIYQVKLKQWFIWWTQYETSDRQEAERIYREILTSVNIEEG